MEQLPLTSSAEIAASLFVSRRARSAVLPTPRLEPVALPFGRTLELVMGLRATSSPLGPHQLLVGGPLVTYGALREGLWAQRHSLGLWIESAATDSAHLAEQLRQVWGIAPVALEGELFAGPEREPERPPAAGVATMARNLVSLESFLGRDVFFYSRRGARLLSSRLRIEGHMSFGPGVRAWIPTPHAVDGLPLTTARGEHVGLELHGPGREYDI